MIIALRPACYGLLTMTKDGRRVRGRQLQVALSFGFSLSGSILMGYVVGGWLDDRFDTSPWFVTAGIVLGVTAAFTAFLRQWRNLEQQAHREEE